MAKKELGHVELQWKCPNCSALNPGPERLCLKCGAPQPANVQFEQAEHQVLITDETVKEKVAAGADIHCPYCGARNPASVKVCGQCGGDLTTGVRRETGKVLGALDTGSASTIKCPRCGADNLETAKECISCGASLSQPKEAVQPAAAPKLPRLSPVMIAAFIVGLMMVCGICAVATYSLTRTETFKGTVEMVQWERSVPIEAFVPVTYSDWKDQIPSEAEVGSCDDRLRSVESEPVPNSVEVCGTPYTVDTGTGYGDVVQDCEYQVYDTYCSYSINEWKQVDTATTSGEGFNAVWPNPDLMSGQRLGEDTTETYTIIFASDGETYTYQVHDFNQFQEYPVGSTWNIKVNKLGGVVSVEK
jgi:DNA-directed RNA polymerase subunit RPC12/RpoP